jgi:prophage tail gpP-like protein
MADVVTFPATPNPDEIATIVAAAHRFEDWESVYVQHRWTDAFAWFRFTSVERESDPPSFDWQTLRLKPPDSVQIYVGGQLAINGLITSRQVAYEGNNHAIQLEGRGLTWAAATSSILDKTQDYNGMTFEQIARRVLAPTGVGIKVIGTLNARVFERAAA